MTVFQQVLFVVSVTSTIILVIQTILAIIGIAGNNNAELGDNDIGGDSGGDIDIADDIDVDVDISVDSVDTIDSLDVDSDVDIDGDIGDIGEHVDSDGHSRGPNLDSHGLRIFTVRGIMAFLMVGSWVGFLLSKAGINEFIATLFAFASGVATLILMAKMMQGLMGLQADGTIKVKNALGQIGQVYIRIPADENQKGKVTVTIQERLCEFEAVTEKGEIIKTGEMVYVTDIKAGNVLVVEKVDDKS